MDLEKTLRTELCNLLSGHFNCFEEVKLRHSFFNEVIRTDVLGILKTDQRIVFAFEVKSVDINWEFKNWTSAIKQASDYVFSNFDRETLQLNTGSTRVLAAFVFAPSPDSNPKSLHFSCRDYDSEAIRGAFLLATHFRVGSAVVRTKGGIELKLGTTPVFDSTNGFRDSQKSLIDNFRLGSRKIPLPF